ncbi:MAG: hypothetical protein BWX47_01067 [candidate division Hyd24-12 bacterium ADurb.Bin004]|nr:MAG: hypothetical protein BWX47_01067 [candidate division Hyd24-12 bacterium ADurb.Bin004]
MSSWAISSSRSVDDIWSISRDCCMTGLMVRICSGRMVVVCLSSGLTIRV